MAGSTSLLKIGGEGVPRVDERALELGAGLSASALMRGWRREELPEGEEASGSSDSSLLGEQEISVRSELELEWMFLRGFFLEESEKPFLTEENLSESKERTRERKLLLGVEGAEEEAGSQELLVSPSDRGDELDSRSLLLWDNLGEECRGVSFQVLGLGPS